MNHREDPPDAYHKAVEAMRRHTEEGLGETRARSFYQRLRETQFGSRPKSAWLQWTVLACLMSAAAFMAVVWTGPHDHETSTPSTLASPAITDAMDIVMRSGRIQVGAKDSIEDIPVSVNTVAWGESLQLHNQARLDVAYKNETRIAVNGPAEFAMVSPRQTRLTSGTASFAVGKRATQKPFTIQTGDFIVRVLGTKFLVKAHAGVLDTVEVYTGVVEVYAPGRHDSGVRIEAGNAWRTGMIATLDENHLGATDLQATWWRQLDEDDQVGSVVSIDSVPTGAIAEFGGIVFGVTPFMMRWPSGRHQMSLEKPGFERWQGDVMADARRTPLTIHLRPSSTTAPEKDKKLWALAQTALSRGECARLNAAVDKILLQRSSDDHKARALMLKAECLLRRARKKEALELYRRVYSDYPRTTSAETALFETAKLLSERRENDEALKTTHHYVSTYPQGRFVEAATMRRCELLIRMEHLTQAEACLNAYRRTFPQGIRVHHAVFLCATLARIKKDWPLAASLYKEYLGFLKDT
ncbi:MAG: PEGA domain-containing protein [Myxococcota bacterium]